MAVLFLLVEMQPVSPVSAGDTSDVHTIATIPGRFVAWRNSTELVTVDHEKFTLLNLRTLAKEPVQDVRADPTDIKLIFEATLEPPKAFPGRITNKLRTGGQTVWWKVEGLPIHEGRETHEAPVFAPAKTLIDRADGEVAIYCSPKGHEASEEPPPPNSANRQATYAIVHIRGTKIRLLPMNFDPAVPEPFRSSGYRWWKLTSRRDEVPGRYLLFFSEEVFLQSTKMYGGAGWTPFNVWWLEVHDNPQDDTIESISLPPGPWIDDAKSDGPLRRLTCAPFPCDYFRGYDFAAAGHKVFLRISEYRDVLSKDTLGVYVLDAANRAWRKIGEAEVRLNQVAPDGCAVAVNRKGDVEVQALCPPPQEPKH